MPDKNGVPTTAEMDGWFGDPNDPERWQTYYQCNSCAHWTLFQSDQEHHGHYLPEHRCESCGGKNFNQQSATSKRTFNVERARKKENDLKKLIEKKKQAAR